MKHSTWASAQPTRALPATSGSNLAIAPPTTVVAAYEVMHIVTGAMSDASARDFARMFEGDIAYIGVRAVATDFRGMRPLGVPIGKHYHAYFIVTTFAASAADAKNVERLLRAGPTVLSSYIRRLDALDARNSRAVRISMHTSPETHPFELTFILHPRLDDVEVAAFVATTDQNVLTLGGSCRLPSTIMGRRRLAYEIAGVRDGHYASVYFAATNAQAKLIAHEVAKDPDVLRILLIKSDKA